MKGQIWFWLSDDADTREDAPDMGFHWEGEPDSDAALAFMQVLAKAFGVQVAQVDVPHGEQPEAPW